MSFIELQTSDRERRWINLDQIRRATLIESDNNEPVLVIIFDEDDPRAELKIHGSDELDRKAIEQFVTRMNDLCG